MTHSMMLLCHYAECHCAECHDLFIVLVNVIALRVIMLSAVMLNVVMVPNQLKNAISLMSYLILFEHCSAQFGH